MPLSAMALHCRASFRIKIWICALLVAFADYVWFSHDTGWTASVMNSLLLAGVLLSNTAILQPQLARPLLAAIIGLAVEPVWDLNPLGLFLFAFLLILLTLLPRLAAANNASRLALDVIRQCMLSSRSVCIVGRYCRLHHPDPSLLAVKAIVWIVPILLCGTFVALFAAANPLIDNALGHIDWLAPIKGLSFPRLAFWFLAASFIWVLLRSRYRQILPDARQEFRAACRGALVAMLFDPRSVLAALVMFNLLFALQNGLDVRFLWSGAALPDGMTYASYAHRGAYPLIATALLAGWFVLTALKPGTEMERSPAIRRAVYLFLAQTLVLVASSLLRLKLYVDAYELTYLRAAAFVWMGLVAVGLMLITARIVWRRSGLWLVNANALMLTATLYVCSFVSFGEIIADYNVAHCYEVTGTGQTLDKLYLARIGEDALPGLVRYGAVHPLEDIFHHDDSSKRVVQMLRGELADWHQWTLHRALLARLL